MSCPTEHIQDAEPRGTFLTDVIDMRREGKMSIEYDTEKLLISELRQHYPEVGRQGQNGTGDLSGVKMVECDFVR